MMAKDILQNQTNSLSAVYENKSCVAVADIDNDGDHGYFCWKSCQCQAHMVFRKLLIY